MTLDQDIILKKYDVKRITLSKIIPTRIPWLVCSKYLGMCGEQASKKRYVGVPGMNSICKALASSPGITSFLCHLVAAVNNCNVCSQMMKGHH